jgi:hypothetical protein
MTLAFQKIPSSACLAPHSDCGGVGVAPASMEKEYA